MKNFINKILDVRKLIRNLWICLWICLAILMIMKYCFGIWYPIVIKNETILNISNSIDNTAWQYIIFSVVYVFSGNVLYLISTQKRSYFNIIECILINLLIGGTFVLKVFTNLSIIGELIIGVIIPIIVLLKTDKITHKLILVLYPIIIQCIVTLWQLQILLIRNMPIAMDSIGTIFQIAIQLDYYIFLIILWIGVSYMGLTSFWLFCKDITTLESYKERELAKKNPDMKVVREIDAKIAKLKESK